MLWCWLTESVCELHGLGLLLRLLSGGLGLLLDGLTTSRHPVVQLLLVDAVDAQADALPVGVDADDADQELVALLRAGLPVVTGFEILLERQENAHFKRILIDVKEQLVSGVALSDAFLSHGDTFPRLYATSLKAGERSGEVEKVLRRFLDYQKILGRVKRRVTGAMAYPIVLVSLAVGLIFILMTYVIPKFTEFYAGFGADMPALTVAVVGTATFMRAHLLEILLGTAAAVFAFDRWRRTDSGQRSIDGFLLQLPAVGVVLHEFSLSQFARALATLVGAGTPLVTALEIDRKSVV